MTPLPLVGLAEATRTWMRIGWLSFGGPAGQIAVMHRILVDEKRWISEERFLHALSYCMLLPGPEAQQLATYVGWLMHGIRGGLIAGILFVLPGFVAMLALSFVYVAWQRHPLLEGVFLGLKAAVIALVVEALVRIATRALRNRIARIIACGAFIAIAILHVPFPVIVLGAGLIGYLLARRRPDTHEPATAVAPSTQRFAEDSDEPRGRRARSRAIRLLALWLPLWFAPIALTAMLLGREHVLTQLGVFFSVMAVVTFGGAYAVLAYVAQQAVDAFGWVTPAQMIDGLGLAESTPGPLILVVQFVGFLAAFQAAGIQDPLLAGVAGALITVWVTFVPCFLWIFLGAPHVERARGNPAIAAALQAITAAVVGVIANLAWWFATHVWFANHSPAGLPQVESIQAVPIALTVIALVLTFVLRAGLTLTLVTCTALGAASTWL